MDPRAARGHPRGDPARRPVRRLDLPAVAAAALDGRHHRREPDAARTQRSARSRRAGFPRRGPHAARQPRREPDEGRHRPAQPLARRADRAHRGSLARGRRGQRRADGVLARPLLVHVQRARRTLALGHDPGGPLRHTRDRLPAVADADAGRDRGRPAQQRQPERRRPPRGTRQLEPARRPRRLPALVHLQGHGHAADGAHRHARRLDDHRAGGHARVRRPLHQVGEARGASPGRHARRGRRLAWGGSRLVRATARAPDGERPCRDGAHARPRWRPDRLTGQLRQQRLRVRRPAGRSHPPVHVHPGRPRARRRAGACRDADRRRLRRDTRPRSGDALGDPAPMDGLLVLRADREPHRPARCGWCGRTRTTTPTGSSRRRW